MKLKSLLLLSACAAMFFASGACSHSVEPEDNTLYGTDTDSTAAVFKDHDYAGDYVWNESEVIKIALNGTSIVSNSAGAVVIGSNLVITKAGTYSLSGTLTDGQIVVDTEDKAIVRLIFNGMYINCSTSAPVYVKKAFKTVIFLPDNTSNILTDGSKYVLENTAVNEPNAALYSKSCLTIFGSGSLKVTGNYNDAIASKDGLILENGNISVSSVDDGIRGKDYLVIKSGTITLNVKGDGLKSDNAVDAGKGYILVDSGTLNITSSGDAITAQNDVILNGGIYNITTGGGSSQKKSDVSTKAIKGLSRVIINSGTFNINSSDDAVHSNNSININGGTFSISSGDDGMHADEALKINNGRIIISKAVEGIESASITVNNGNISVSSSDDGFNSTKGTGGQGSDGSCLSINGGSIYVNTTLGDGLDSNGDIVMTGGTVIVNGPKSNPEVGADYNGTFNISGGLLVFTGPNSGNMIEATSTSSEQYAVKVTAGSQVSASSLFHVQDENGNDIITFQPVRSFYYIVFSSPSLKNGAAYSIYTGGKSTGTNINGLYTGGTYSGGTQKKSFTISGKVTNVTF